MTFPKDHFRRALVSWYRKNGRDLPWRRTRDPYAILVSEIMLQQTQVATVIPYYEKWVRRFPGFTAVARASEQQILNAWEGLGYYTRARNLHATARITVDQHGGEFPSRTEEMRRLPGIGKYTANAIAAFAFDQSVPVVETNTGRVLSRLFNIKEPIDQSKGRAALWKRSASLVPKASARVFHSALLDLGALICLPRPRCMMCPVKDFCRATNPEALPHKKARLPIQQLNENHGFTVRRNKVLLEQSQNRWRGMWTLPVIGSQAERSKPIFVSTFPFTNHRITLQIFRQCRRKVDREVQQWFTFAKLKSIPIPSPHRRAIEEIMRR